MEVKIPMGWSLICASLILIGCGGGGGGGGGGAASAGPGGAGPAPTGATYYVDATAGSDANPGTSGSPFKTITKAMTVAVSGDTVQVRPGTYDGPGNGETFGSGGLGIPIPNGVTLLGDEANKGAGATPTFIKSGSAGTLAAGNGVVIAGFKLTAGAFIASFDAIRIYTGSGTIVRNNTCVGTTGTCVTISASSNHIVRGNVFKTSGHGILVADSAGGAATGIRVENNVLTNNSTGMEIDYNGFAHNTADLGGGAAGSVGGNTLSCNATADFWTNESGAAFSLRNNLWDHATPTIGTSLTDIYNAGSTSLSTPNTLDTAGPTVAAGACP